MDEIAPELQPGIVERSRFFPLSLFPFLPSKSLLPIIGREQGLRMITGILGTVQLRGNINASPAEQVLRLWCESINKRNSEVGEAFISWPPHGLACSNRSPS